MGQRLPPLNVDLSLAARAPKANPKEAAAEGQQEPGVDVTAKVDKVSVAAKGMRFPPQLEQEVGKLKGSTVTFRVSKDGKASGFLPQVAKEAGPAWNLAAQSLGTALSLSLLPYPEEPLGVGGYFLATTRSELAGVAVLVYRMVKIVNISEGRATLDISGREYAVDRAVSTPDLAGGRTLHLNQFSAQSSGKAEIAAGQFYPMSSESSLGLRALLVPPGEPTSPQSSAKPGPDPQRQRMGLQAKIGFSLTVDGVANASAFAGPVQPTGAPKPRAPQPGAPATSLPTQP